MPRLISANTDDLISVLDRVMDKGIVLESWARLSLQEAGLASSDITVPARSRISVESSAVYVGYATRGAWRHDLDKEKEDMFPLRRLELWKK
jgi:hypothetical protein